MIPIRDLSNKVFGRWSVLSRGVNGPNNEYATWLCRCECGTEREVMGRNLRSNASTSCGCYQRECAQKLKILPKGEASLSQLFNTYRQNAKIDSREFKLTKEEFRTLTKGNCFYCGAKPSQVVKKYNRNGEYIYNGVDRLDSSKGYAVENCVSACGTHNLMKLAMSVDEFLEACRSVARLHPN